ncbi:Quinoprotein glucose dehydrogenase B precursor [Neorhodopirellula pilleata]|uniref:Quinoprotein glucose dehydrogenase B n=2 Tax=Neorhodopirellula pilleata TaxID=2714738 RepID=A0A5C5ZK70_9BACT|nr:Quinoprotein glucose dehydrogenase B precursor [Neorhodopirellula pilleata]
MLAGDAGAEVATAAHSSDAETGTAEIAFVDAEVQESVDIVSLARRGVEIVLLDDSSSAIEQMNDAISRRNDLSAVHIFSHGQSGRIEIGGQMIDQTNADEWSGWSSHLHPDADILIYGCDVADGLQGKALLRQIARVTGADVAGSINATGSIRQGGDWELEFKTGSVESQLIASLDQLNQIEMVLPITIRAAGTTGLEQMQLEVDGVIVQTWNNIGGNANQRQFQTYTYNGAPDATLGDVRVRFINDFADRANGIDRNLRIDSITVNGSTRQSEDPTTFGTGTWLNTDGIAPGFRESEWIHTNGYFQYADLNNAGSRFEIYAAGYEGSEQMELWIDGVQASVWNDIGGNAITRDFVRYNFTADRQVDIGDVEIRFTNDLVLNSGQTDRNLRVDRIVVDGVTYETEAPTVYSNGTWINGGITPGFVQSEWLHINGAFQYGAQSNNGSQIEIYAAGYEGSERMELWIGGTQAQVWNNIGGNTITRNFIRYDFSADREVDISDVEVRFTNDLYINNGETDRNLRVDRIVVDGVSYETESPTVFSNGTWLNGGITPGFVQSEWLHINGSFQYGAEVGTPGTIALQTSNLIVDEGSGEVRVNVVRTGGKAGVVTVDYDTFAGTATDGADYRRQSGTLTFNAGETVKSIVVPILNDSLLETNETFNVTIDNVRGNANLSVPRTATVSITDDDVNLPSYANFQSVVGLDLNGNARRNGNALELTGATSGQSGSAFFTTPISLTNDGSFRTAFSFEATGGGGTNGADGLTFVIQNDPLNTSALGGTGDALGYQGITRSVAVEFDTYRNGADVNDNHVSILAGSTNFSLKSAIPGLDLNSGSRVYAWVDYNGSSDVLAVYVSQSNTRPATALLKTTVDLTSIVGDQGYVGFTAATGGRTNSHRILNWSLNQDIPPRDPPTTGGDEVRAVTVASGLNQPTAIEWLPDGTMLIAEQSGRVRASFNGTVLSTPFIDISNIVNGTRDRGLLDIAVHPDFANNPYVYLLFTYDPPEVNNQAAGTLAGADGRGNRAGRLIRVTADSTNNYRTAISGSEVVLLGNNSTWQNFNGFANSTTDFSEPPAGELPDGTYIEDFINSDSESHTVGALAFGIDGELFVSIGDGASYNRVDVRADRVQDIDSLSGKVLRIDPLTGRGLSDNPFFNGDPDANRSKVYQLGLRNPFRMSVDPVTGQLFVGDVGWTRWEEINAAGPGANFGWPFYEGGSGTSIVNQGYAATPEGQAFFANSVQVTSSQYALSHQADGINAIVMGDVYRGSVYGSEYFGDVFFNDLGQGIVRHADVGPNGEISNVKIFTTGSSVIVAISQGPDGSLYFVDLNDNTVGRWDLV